MNINIEINDVVLSGVDFRESQSLELRRCLESEVGELLGSSSNSLGQTRNVSVAFHSIPTGESPSPRGLAAGMARFIGQSVQGYDTENI